MAKIDTLAEMWRPLMGRPSLRLERCAICGRAYPLNQHHIVRRGAGKLYDERGGEIEKPTITLCGTGNVLHDADGVPYCHGLAHAHMLHFRWAEGIEACAGYFEFLITDEPTPYLNALEMNGWRSVWEAIHGH